VTVTANGIESLVGTLHAMPCARAATRIRPLAALAAWAVLSLSTAAAHGGPRDWLIVTGDDEASSVGANVAKLQSDLARISSGVVRTTTVLKLTAEDRSRCNLMLVGEVGRNTLARQVLDAHGRSDLPAQPAGPVWAAAQGGAFVQEQGYVVDVYPNEFGAGRKTIAAVGWHPLGAIFAISHLRTRMLSERGRLYLDAEGSATSSHRLQITERPSIEERAVYWYVAYNLSYGQLTPDNWQERDWEYWVDKAVCAQFTQIAFCLWGGSEYYFPGSPACFTEKVRRTHECLRHMIAYAHSRGLKVTCLLSPTFIPTDIVDANGKRLPFLRASGHYGEHLKTICQAEPGTIVMGDRTWKGSMALILDVMDRELDWFLECDTFQIWFYDPGGCYCGSDRYNCKGLQDKRLMEQVAAMVDLIGRRNPAATIEVSLWPMWLLETKEYLGWPFRAPFLDELKSKYPKVTCTDVVGHPNTGLDAARDKGFRTNGFFYTTNPETGYVFVNPMFSCLNYLAASARNSRTSAAYVYRHEEGAKFPNTFFASRYLWNLSSTTDDVLRQYVNWIANTSPDAAGKLQQAFLLLDAFTCEGTSGRDHAATGAQISRLVEGALARLPAWRRAELEWLRTTARAMAILGKGVENRQDAAALATFRKEFCRLMEASPAFAGFAPYADAKYQQFVDWLAKGWNQTIF